MDNKKEYIPTCLRDIPEEKREKAFGIGEQHGPHEIGMWFGPCASEEECLEEIGTSEKSCIVRFNEDGTDAIIWRWEEDRWIGVEE